MNRNGIILWLLIGVGVLVAVGALGWLGMRHLARSGLTRGPDQMFGDQWLKTGVALVELHKTRYGRYPKNLGELTFLGSWDRGALQSLRYATNAAQTKYCLEVTRGWVGQPELRMPAEFWQGTGYDPSLCSHPPPGQ